MSKLYCLLTLLAALPFSACAAGSYVVDGAHSHLRFSVSHFLFLTTHGRFEKISGKVTLDRVAKIGSIEVAIAANSINTEHAKRDENLRSDNFFNAAKYPLINYQSSVVKFINDSPASVEGTLTLLGVPRPVTLTLHTLQCGLRPTDNVEECSATASTQINRSDFDMSYGHPLIGDQIKLEFSIEMFGI